MPECPRCTTPRPMLRKRVGGNEAVNGFTLYKCPVCRWAGDRQALKEAT